VILALCCGAGVGGGLFFVFRGLYPPRPSLAQALAQLRLVPEAAPVLAPEVDSGFAARLGRPAARVLHRSGAGWLIPQRVRRDLAVLDRSSERHLAEKLTLALVGLLFAPAITALLLLGGAHLSLAVPLWASLVFMVGGFVLPDLGIRAEAGRRRRDFRHALGSFLDLVVVALAGGGGVETALGDAASIGDSWAFSYLRRALDGARLARETRGQLSGGWAPSSGSVSCPSWPRRSPWRAPKERRSGRRSRPRPLRCVPTSWPRPRPPTRPPQSG